MLLALSLALAPQIQAPGEPPALPAAVWAAWLDSPGGELPFGLVLHPPPARRAVLDGDVHPPGSIRACDATILNGAEAIPIEAYWRSDGGAEFERWTLHLPFPEYDSEIRATTSLDGAMLAGEWIKRRGAQEPTRMDFFARMTPVSADSAPRVQRAQFAEHRFRERPARPGAEIPTLAARYAVKFSASEDLAIGLFETLPEIKRPNAPRIIHGTFLTTTGDYRYLAGTLDATGLRLSCFDGAHAFLFHAEAAPGAAGSAGGVHLNGEFWSRDSWHETWSATPDPDITLPDAWAQVGLKPVAEQPDWRAIPVHELDGTRVALGELAARDREPRAQLLVLFGSWCPNCHDEHHYLKELHERYAARGLAITSLAFELGGERTRNLDQLRLYRGRLALPWPVALVADSTDKTAAAEAFPVLTALKSYPTTLFVDSSGAIRAVYSGFSGPATGEAHQELRRAFEQRIERLLAQD